MSGSAGLTIPQNVEVAIIGGGLGGLVCGIELSRQGLNTAVFEKEQVGGGYAQNYRKKGYHFDISLHHIGGLKPGQFTHGCLQSLGVLDELQLVESDELFKVELPGFALTLPNNKEGIIKTLSNTFPDEKEGIAALFEFLPKLKNDVVAPVVNSNFNTPLHDRPGAEYINRTYQELLLEFVSDKRLLAVLGQMWSFVGLPPSQSSANYTAAVNASSFIDGEQGIVGGGAALVRKLTGRLRDLGGESFTGNSVDRIIVKDGKSTGIVLDSGQVVNARIVISAVNPVYTFNTLLSSNDVSHIYRYRLGNMTPSLSMYTMHMGLDCDPLELGFNKSSLFFNYSSDLDSAFERVLSQDLARTDYSVTNASHLGMSVSPAGCGIVSFVEPAIFDGWFNLDKASYREKKEATKQILLKKYEDRFPGLREHAEAISFLTPATLERSTNNYKGAVFGFAQSVEQSNYKRLSNKTPVAGLFLTGAWTFAGGGYEGAIASGIQTASVIMAEYKFKYSAPRILLHPEIKNMDHKESKKRVSKPLIKIDNDINIQSHYKYSFAVTVYGDELNSRGNADASSYLKYMDRARMEAIETICKEAGSTSWMDEYQIKIYRIEARCATVIRLADNLEVRTGLRKISNHRASFDQRIINTHTGVDVVDAVVEVLFLNSDDQLVPVPKELNSDDDDIPSVANEKIEMLPFNNDELFPFRTRFRVYFEDTDLQGIMFHVSYVRYCERAMFDLIRSIWPDVSLNKWMTNTNATVAKIDIRYLQATVLGERLEVRTSLLDMDSSKLRFGQRIVRMNDGVVVADAVTDVEFRDGQGSTLGVPKQIADVASAQLSRLKQKVRQ